MRMLEGAYVYILRCADRSYYVGVTRGDPELRLAQHNAGSFPGYTFTRRPVDMVFVEWFERIIDAIESERQIKRWSRAKKEALIRGDFAALRVLASRKRRSKSDA
jgi:putative endonuclease